MTARQNIRRPPLDEHEQALYGCPACERSPYWWLWWLGAILVCSGLWLALFIIAVRYWWEG